MPKGLLFKQKDQKGSIQIPTPRKLVIEVRVKTMILWPFWAVKVLSPKSMRKWLIGILGWRIV